MSNKNVITLTEQNFEEIVTNSESPVFIDFWAPWCGPCRMLGPIIDELAQEYIGKVTIAKLNVDENPNIAGKFGIRGSPTVKIIKEGKEVFSASGAYPKKYWTKALQQVQ